MRARNSIVWVAPLLLLAQPRNGEPRSLNDQLGTLAQNLSQQVVRVGTGRFVLGSTTNFEHAGSFFSTGLPGNERALQIRAQAFQAADFPATSTAPGFSYFYNPELNTFERSKGSLGPLFAERAETTGKGHIDVGAFYLRENFQEIDNQSLDGTIAVSGHTDHAQPPPPAGLPPDHSTEQMTVTYDKFKLVSNVFALFGTYGITDRWDVNLLVPLVATSMEAQQSARVTGFDTTLTNQNGTKTKHQFLNQGTEQQGIRVSQREATGSVSDTVFGVGDIFLRTKYRLTAAEGLLEGDATNVAGAFTMRLPSGNQDNFQGGGDVTLWPFVIASRGIGPHEVHGNFGVEFDPQNVDRSRLQYALGGSIKLLDWLSGMLDVIGSSQFADQSVDTTVAVPESLGPTLAPATTTKVVPVTVPRTDVVNLSLGFKTVVFGSGVAFVTAVVPLANNGLRPGVVPVVGFEYGF